MALLATRRFYVYEKEGATTGLFPAVCMSKNVIPVGWVHTTPIACLLAKLILDNQHSTTSIFRDNSDAWGETGRFEVKRTIGPTLQKAGSNGLCCSWTEGDEQEVIHEAHEQG